MANFSYSYTFIANDQFSAVNDKIGKNLSNLTQKVETANKSLEKFGKGMVKIGKKLSLRVSAPIVAAGTLSVRTAGKFEQAMERMRITAGLTNKQFSLLEKQAKTLGTTTTFTALTVAQAQSTLAEKGFDFNQIMAATPSALTLASAAMLDVGDAAEITARLMKGYNFSAKDMNAVNDKLTFIATRTNMDLSELSRNMRKVKIATDAAGMGFTETLSILAVLDKQGFDTRQSLSALRTGIQNLIHPSKEVRNTLRLFGIQTQDVHGKLLPLTNIITQFKEKVIPSGREKVAMAIFGQTAGEVFAKLIEEGAPAIQSYNDQLNKLDGLSTKLAKAQLKNLSGSEIRLKEATDILSLAYGKKLTPTVDIILDKFASLEMRLANTSETTQNVISTTMFFGAALSPVLIVLGKIVIIFALLGNKIPIFGKSITLLGLSFNFLWKSLFRPIVILTTIITLFDLAYNKVTMFKNAVNETSKILEKVFKKLDINAIFPGFGNVMKFALSHVEKLKNAVSNAGLQTMPTTASGTTAAGMARHSNLTNLLQPSLLKQAVKSSLEINVHDPSRLIKSISGKSDGDMNFNLGQSMAFSRI